MSRIKTSVPELHEPYSKCSIALDSTLQDDSRDNAAVDNTVLKLPDLSEFPNGGAEKAVVELGVAGAGPSSPSTGPS